MICSICKKETPCEHNDRKGATFYSLKDGKLVPSQWDGLFESSEITPADLKFTFFQTEKKAIKICTNPGCTFEVPGGNKHAPGCPELAQKR